MFRTIVVINLLTVFLKVNAQSITFNELDSLYRFSETQIHLSLTLKGFSHIGTTHPLKEKKFPQIEYGKGKHHDSLGNYRNIETIVVSMYPNPDKSKKDIKTVSYYVFDGEIFDIVAKQIVAKFAPGKEFKRPDPGTDAAQKYNGSEYTILLSLTKTWDGFDMYSISIGGPPDS